MDAVADEADVRTGASEPPNRFVTLVIASLASVVAAVVTRELFDAGVLVSAAVTPVIVALVNDTLSPLSRRRPAPAPAPRRRPSIVAAVLIGLVAFLLAAVVMTYFEVKGDGSITGGSDQTTYFGSNEGKPWTAGQTLGDCLDSLSALEDCARELVE